MPLTWKDYVGLRGISEKAYFETHNISSYEQLLTFIDKRDVLPPAVTEVSEYFVERSTKTTVPKKQSSSQKVDISKRSTKKTTTRRRNVKKKPPLKT